MNDPYEIAKDTAAIVEQLDGRWAAANELFWAAVEHYRNGHWAEARTAALIGRLAVELAE